MAQLSVKDLLSRDFVGVSESDSVLGAVELMREDGETGVVVLRGSEAVGVLSAADVLDVIAEGRDLAETPVSEVMRREPPTIPPEARVDEAASMLTRSGAEQVLVSAQDGVVGVVSVRDLATIGWESGDRPEEIEVTTQGADMVQGERIDTEYSNQSICEVCGSLSRDLVNVNGQLLCPDCRSM
jgi:CBS domain-containing protein